MSERKVFYIDVGDIPPKKAEKLINDIMNEKSFLNTLRQIRDYKGKNND